MPPPGNSNPANAPGAQPLRPEEVRRFFVGNLGRQITEDDLRQHFSRFAPLVEVRVQRDGSNLPLGYGWIGFAQPCPQIMQHQHIVNEVTLDVQIPKNNDWAIGGRSGALPKGGPVAERKRSRSPHSAPRRADSRTRRNRRSRSPRSPPRRGSPPRNTSNPVRRPEPLGVPQPRYVPQNLAPQPIHPQQIRQLPPPPAGPPPPLHPAGAISTAAETFVCIPYAICPIEIVRNPNVLIGKYDRVFDPSVVVITEPAVAAPAAAPAPIYAPPQLQHQQPHQPQQQLFHHHQHLHHHQFTTAQR